MVKFGVKLYSIDNSALADFITSYFNFDGARGLLNVEIIQKA